MKRSDRIQLAIFAVSGLGYFPFSEWLSTTRIGTRFFLWGQMIYFLFLMAAILAIPVLVICLLSPRTRQPSFFYLLISAVFIPCCIVGIMLGKKTRTVGMESFAQRSQALINAIKNYELDNNSPPPSLNDLVPNYIPTVPSTGMMAYPEYRYHVGDETKEQYADNSWALSVLTPSGGINFDMMLYLPDHNYPPHAYGGWLETVGNWGYVHE